MYNLYLLESGIFSFESEICLTMKIKRMSSEWYIAIFWKKSFHHFYHFLKSIPLYLIRILRLRQFRDGLRLWTTGSRISAHYSLFCLNVAENIVLSQIANISSIKFIQLLLVCCFAKRILMQKQKILFFCWYFIWNINKCKTFLVIMVSVYPSKTA